MAYTKTVWKNNQPPALNETNLNKIEEGVFEAHGLVEDSTRALWIQLTLRI